MEKKRYPIGQMSKRLLQNINQKNKKIYGYFILYTLTGAIFPFFSVLLPKYLLEELTKGDQAKLINIGIIVGSFFIVASLVGFIQTYIQHHAYPRMTHLRIDYIADLFDKTISSAYPYMEDSEFFAENQRVSEAVGSNNTGIEEVYHQLFLSPAELLSTIGFILLIGYLNIWILLGIVIHLGVTLLVNYRVHQYEYSKRHEVGKTNRKKDYYYQTTYDFAYGKDIRIYKLKDRILHNYYTQIQTFTKIQSGIKQRAYIWSFVSLVTLLLSDGLIYGMLIRETLNGLSIADFSMYLASILSLSSLFLSFTNRMSRIYSQGQYVYEYFSFMDRDLGEKGGNVTDISEDTLIIEFVNVSFKYPRTDRYIIKDLNLTIQKGEKLAIVGVNGAGKTTLVKLMTGLFPVTEGKILINGIPIEQFDKKALYRMFSVVFQDINILAFPMKENIAASSKAIDDERVKLSLEKVGLYEKVQSLPKDIDTMMLKIIEPDGIELSGGEMQKLAIARALYKNGKMVIMDEPTAALDALAEAEIYQQMNDLVGNKTAVYISHRLASTKFCDKIAFFDQDGLKEYGSHDELMAKRGSYYEMFKIQGKYYQEGGENLA